MLDIIAIDYIRCYALLKMIEVKELASELVAFLNSTGQYQAFIDWEEERGYDIIDLEDAISDVEDF